MVTSNLLYTQCMTTVVIVGLSFFVCDRDAFKAVAMVFLLEVDNLVYLFIVSDATKKDMEEVGSQTPPGRGSCLHSLICLMRAPVC